jgi:CRP-like cAMP-binding protein
MNPALALPSEELRHFKTGDIILAENDRADGVYIVREGLVQIFHTIRNGETQREVELGRIGMRGIFGEMGLIDYKPRSASARALSPCILAFISREVFQKSLDQLPPSFQLILKTFVTRLRQTNEKLVAALEKNPLPLTDYEHPHDVVISLGDEDY